MFSKKEFINASRSFVCIRIETYENKEAEEMVRSLLNGRLANTSFCMFDPNGKKRLSGSGRSPSQLFSRWKDDVTTGVVREMKYLVRQYSPRGEKVDAVLQDFLTFKQALNVASADQRLLVYVNADKAAAEKISPQLKSLFVDEDVIGRFHLDIAGKEDKDWAKAVTGSKTEPAINIIRSGKFGMDGVVMEQLPLSASQEEIKKTLLVANKKFGETEKRKTYAEHVMEGKRKGISYETEIPYGEDLDGDGEIDQRRSRNGRSGGRSNDGGGGRKRGRGQDQ